MIMMLLVSSDDAIDVRARLAPGRLQCNTPAMCVTRLASDRAAYITGVIAQIDGGLYRGIF